MFRPSLVSQLTLILLFSLGALNHHCGFVFGCHEAEREALFKFKHSLVNLENGLSSWKGKDCCNWEGVGCNNVTSYVNRLDLHNPNCFRTTDPYVVFRSFLIAPSLDPSLLELWHLNYLDLSCNDFQGSLIPGFIGSFKHLTHLNLSYSKFSGIVPFQLGNLTRLQNLDLSLPDYPTLSSNLQWTSDLVSLQYLSLGGLSISQSMNSMLVLTELPSLLGLRLPNCGLGNPQVTSLLSNSTWVSRIQQLDLSENNLEGPLPHVFPNMTSLTYLDLSANHLNGSITLWVRNMRKLEYLDLSVNSFSPIEGGAIMGIIENLCKLKTFDLSVNSVGGSMRANHNFSTCVSYDLEFLKLRDNMIGGALPSWLKDFKYLEELDLSYNNLEGTLPNYLGDLTALRVLNVASNSISGRIPTSVGNLSALEQLSLYDNNLNGIIPEGLGRCKKLVDIILSSNFLQGAVSESHLANLSRLSYLELSFNPIDLILSSNWTSPFQLSILYMASCKIQAPFPQWIGKQTKLEFLDLSDNMITGKLVPWFSSTQLAHINISHNRITGPVPYFFFSKLESVDLSNNMITGPLLHDGSSAKNDIVKTPFCQQPNLWFIDLQRNKIAGTIPDCWGDSKELTYINLSSNNLSGNIPMSMGLLTSLTFLKLSNNSLQGSIPPTLSSNTSLVILDLGENKLVGNLPVIYTDLRILRLRGNRLVGAIPPALCLLSALHFIDLAHNNLTGSIPRCLGNLISMKSFLTHGYLSTGPSDPRDDSTMVVLKGIDLQYTTTLNFVVNLDLSCNTFTGSIPKEIANLVGLIGLNLSHNHLTGNIPNKIGEMRLLESLDLSNNNLSGTIPTSISDLTSLIAINLSYNNLHGQIPTGHQLQVINNPLTAYTGNPGLCGDPLPNKCKTSNTEIQPQPKEQHNKDNTMENPWFYLVIMSGFATGFWGVVGSLLLKRRFRFALFQLVDQITDYFYVQVMVRFRNYY